MPTAVREANGKVQKIFPGSALQHMRRDYDVTSGTTKPHPEHHIWKLSRCQGMITLMCRDQCSLYDIIQYRLVAIAGRLSSYANNKQPLYIQLHANKCNYKCIRMNTLPCNCMQYMHACTTAAHVELFIIIH